MGRQVESLAAWIVASAPELDQVVIALHAHVMKSKQLAISCSSPAEHQKHPLEALLVK